MITLYLWSKSLGAEEKQKAKDVQQISNNTAILDFIGLSIRQCAIFFATYSEKSNQSNCV